MSFPLEMVVETLEREVSTYQVPVVDLIATQTRDPFRVLVATILSARTRDEVTAAASRRLFARADSPESLARLPVTELERLIHPVGFFRQKAKHLSRLPGVLAERFGGVVPCDLDALLTLPGVGRKTANLVLAVAFNEPAICVDTHVHRIMNIWGYVQTTTPLETEKALREKLPRPYWIRINALLVAFGQGTCKPHRPHCDRCVIAAQCPRIGVTPRRVPKEVSRMEQAATAMRFVSWNVNGLRAALKNGFLDVVGELDADILALQEIKAQPDQLPEEVKAMDGYHHFWNPAVRKGYSGTAVFSRVTHGAPVFGMGIEQHDREGRLITLDMGAFTLVNCYTPNAQRGLTRLDYRMQWEDDFRAYLRALDDVKPVVLCGDLNVAHREIDLANPKANVKNPGFSPEERAWMDEVTGLGYVDTFRVFDPSPGRYTWWSYRFNARAKNIGWRIDYFLVDPASRERVLEAAIHDSVTGSDHCPVSLLFK